MLSAYSPKTQDLLKRLNAFFEQHIYPNEARHHAELEALRRAGDPWQPLKLIDELKVKAREVGLWNMFLPH
ncbi:MAG: acyl-CoA dehydrogenase, partial [Rhodoferax sp.]|nr:acyl-CoA dehydrogenase [Rhodoferax sp.]